MGKFKGVLKKITGGLKMAAAFAPIAIAGAGLVVAIGGFIGSSVHNEKALDYKNTLEYATVYMQDAQEIDKAYQNGEITDEEFQEKVNYHGSNEYVYEVIGNDENADKYKEHLKQMDISNTVGYTGLGLVGGGLVLSAAWYIGSSSLADKLVESADDDFDYQWEEEQRLEREKYEAERKKQEEEDKPFIENEEENLPSIEEQYL